jgi:diguanylate cyclase (GGDEF)-like protein
MQVPERASGINSRAAGKATRPLRGWILAALFLALAGCGLSVLAGVITAGQAAGRSRSAFRLDAMQANANLGLEVQRDSDLLTGVAAFMQETRGFRPPAFRRWVADTRALTRYPEVLALAVTEPSTHADACPATTLAGQPAAMRYSALAQQSICHGKGILALSPLDPSTVDFGLSLGGVRFLGESLAVYRTPTPPATAAGRRRAFIGWATIAVNPAALLTAARSTFTGLGVALTTRVGRKLTFASGPRAHNALWRVRLADGLTETITGTVQGASIFDDSAALARMGGLSAISVLLALTLFLLATGRARAMRIVADKTDELAYHALHDSLTGLANRTLLMDRIGHALARSGRGGPAVAVLFVDLDGFKNVNDTYGHSAGDELLRSVGARLRDLLRDSDTVGRIGGDEFVIVLEPDGHGPTPELVAARVLAALAQPVTLMGELELRLTASIGIAVGRQLGSEELLRNADLALYAAKRAGKSRYVLFEDAMQTAIADRLGLELDLGRALDHNELYLLYQPTFHLDDLRVSTVEALVRWQHPSRGLVAPSVFIPIAEESGLILEIGHWVAVAACTQGAAWRARGLEVMVAINVSGRQLDEPDFVQELRSILEQTGLEPAALTLEITETSLMRDPAKVSARLHQLRELGVRIAIDDFGTGYSSLAYLSELPVDTLKIDRSFISGPASTGHSAVLVDTLIALGRTLQIETLGEGIEDESQLQRLLAANCELGQGFLLARPQPAEQIEALLIASGAGGGPLDPNADGIPAS